MSFRRNFANPFYVMLLLAGLVFSITACAYGVMTVRGLKAPLIDHTGSGNLLMNWLDANGFRLMLIELAVLAMFCALAIGTDSFWERRAKR